MSQALPKRSEDFSAWYNELVKKSGLAENSPVRGCMTIKPYGYALWEKMKAVLDKSFKDTGHENAYFPLLIPKSFLSKEASHIEGFAKECAVVTHYRLKNDAEHGIIVDPEAQLEEELIIRPTSETIIWKTYKNWIQSYRDLPILINQWANVVRWEMRTRLFLRTTEILWQEGHTAHATKDEAENEARQMLDIYYNFAKDYMAMPVIRGIKTENEKFAGADITYTIEGLMQDGKALQVGTSHFLGQNFAKAFDVQFSNAHGQLEYVWGSSWGVTTRLIGALIMTHSDDEGLVLPPNLAPIQIVIIPIYKTDQEKTVVLSKATEIKNTLCTQNPNLSIKIDGSENRTPGWKFADYELKGVPIRVSIGNRDLQNNTLEVVRRDTKERVLFTLDNYHVELPKLLQEIQENLYNKALTMRNAFTTKVDSYQEFKDMFSSNKDGFILAHWDGTIEAEKQIKQETKATIRCIPMDYMGIENEPGKCIVTGRVSQGLVLMARAY